MTAPEPTVPDPVAAARWARALPEASPWLHEEVARRMAQRLDWITRVPRRWAHWGPARGGLQAHAALVQRYPQAEVYLVEADAAASERVRAALTPAWWQAARWRGPALHAGRPPDQGVDLVWSNMALHAQAQPQQLLAQWQAALAVDGFVMFSCFGPDTLRELRALHQRHGWPPPAHVFTDMHDWGDQLLHAGFAEPVMDIEHITLSFASPERLLQELRELGRNLHPQRPAGLRTPRWLAQWKAAAAAELANPAEGGRLTLSFEIVYGHAFKAAPRPARSTEARIGLDEVKRSLSQRKP